MALSNKQKSLTDALGLNNDKCKFSSLDIDEQLTFLLQTMIDCGVAVCPCCGNLKYLIKHHWYESYAFPLVEYNKMICMSCNNILTRHLMEFERFPIPHLSKEIKKSNSYVASHILPAWEKQLQFYQLVIMRQAELMDLPINWGTNTNKLSVKTKRAI